MTADLFDNPYAVGTLDGLSLRPTGDPLRLHRSMPGYEPTRLMDCPSLAERLGTGTVLVKDEGARLGLPSFKILGASWATVTAIHQQWLPEIEPDIRLVRAALTGTPRRLVAATDGNHGRGVARMAALLGISAHILVPTGTAKARIDAIAGEGASVQVIDGSYDDAVAASAGLADETTLVISDTSWQGYESVPSAVIEGYSTMFREADEQIVSADLLAPTVVCLQAGVGAFAAAGIQHYVPTGARVILVEPRTANCLMVSAIAGGPTLVPGPHTSSMAGLNCGQPSPLAWPFIKAGVSVFVAIDDQEAFTAMRALAEVGVIAGESGAAGLAGLLAAHQQGRSLAGPDDSVLVVNTEGATDPVNYAAIVGGAAVS